MSCLLETDYSFVFIDELWKKIAVDINKNQAKALFFLKSFLVRKKLATTPIVPESIETKNNHNEISTRKGRTSYESVGIIVNFWR